MEKSNSNKQKQKKYYRFFLCTLCIALLWNVNVQAQGGPANARQGKNVTGIVVDTSGEPLIGATIIVNGTSNGTITDSDGKFMLNVADRSSVLKISYMGYITREITLSAEQWQSSQSLNIIMQEDNSMLDEVVVVGYGTQKKVNLTGAVAQVKGETLSNRSVTNITQALQGQVGNLNISSDGGGAPGANQSINLRGYTGLGEGTNGASASPLVVIDGIQGGNINNINMNDVESISVLKDAASAAIYGSNAPFGVILITTKKGKAGAKPTITYENNLSFAQPMNLPRLMNSVEVAKFFNEASANSNHAPMINAEHMERIIDYADGLLSYQTIVDPTAGSDGWLTGHANNDWYDIWFKDVVFNHRHSIGISGSSNSSNYYVGLGYLNQEGIFKVGKDRYQRYNARVNLATDITKWLTFNVRASFARGEQQTIDEDPSNTWQGKRMHAIGRMYAYDPFIYPNGTKNDRYLSFEQAGEVKNTNDYAVLTGEFVLHPLKGWEVTANYTLDLNYSKHSYHQKTVYQTTPKGREVAIYGTPNAFTRSSGRSQHYTINAFSSYEKQLGDHYFKALGGYTQEFYDNLAHSGNNSYLYTDNLPSLKLTYGPNPSIDESAYELAIRGVFGRINYNYKEKYLVEFNGRYDATSRFLKDVRYKFYPGISGAWVPSKEVFWEPITPYVNMLKLRASYGQLGNQNIGGYYPFYPGLNTVQASNSNYIFKGGRDAYVSHPGLVDLSLSWETTSSINFGTDMTFLSNRLNFSFDWYRRKVSDMAGPSAAKPGILGADPPLSNSATMETKGFELSIGWRDQIGAFHYGVNAVLSDYQSKILKYPSPDNVFYRWYPGKKIGEIWGYETVGLFQSEEEIAAAADQSAIHGKWSPGDVHLADLDGDGKVDWGDNTIDNPGDRRVIGNTTPRYAFGVTLNAEYKGFDFTAFFQGVGKRDCATDSDSNLTTYFWGNTGDVNQSNGFKEQLDRWSEDNPNGFFPKFYWGDEMNKNKLVQTRYLINAAYLRLKNVQLGYTFPAKWMDKAKIQKLRVFANVENLFTITNMIKTMDPEFSNSGGYVNGLPDGKVYPLQRTWAFGVNITF